MRTKWLCFFACISLVILLIDLYQRFCAVPLPESYGIYAVDHRKLTYLEECPVSEQVSFIVFDSRLKEPAMDLDSIKLHDCRRWTGQQPLTVATVTKRIRGQPSMVLVTPEKPLTPGLYQLVFGDTSAMAFIGVQTHDVVKFLEEVLREYPDNWQAHNHLGAILYKRNQFAEAVTHFERAAKLKPDDPEVQNNLGAAWKRIWLDKPEAMGPAPEDMALRRIYATTLCQVRKYDEAAEQFRKLLVDAPQDADMHATLGSIEAQLGRFAEARHELESALQIAPNNARAKRCLELLRRIGK